VKKYALEITEDEAVVLFEFFERFAETDRLELLHPAEYLALQRLSAQIDKTTSAMFDPSYADILAEARTRLAAGFEGEIPSAGSDP
jgi:hypothetical protein